MELYIRIVGGQPFEHPIMGDNFRQAFPHIDVNNLPSDFARFERFAPPNTAGVFEVEQCSYQWDNGIVKDVWTTRAMTAEEETQKRQELTNIANASIEYLKTLAQTSADEASTDETKQSWLNYLVQLNAWVLVDPVNPNIPNPPTFSSNGMALEDVSGSEPDVIG